MGLLAADLNDAEIIVVDDEKILYREPGFALLEADHLVSGAEATPRLCTTGPGTA